MKPTTAEEYMLDATGFTVLPQLVDPQVLASIRAKLVDRASRCTHVKIPCIDVDPKAIFGLLNQPIFQLCRYVLGEGFRLDHLFARVQPDSLGNQVAGLHGGPGSGKGAHLYATQAGHIYCGQLSVGFPLDPQGGKAGGLHFLPGSHKSLYPLAGQEVLQGILGSNLQHRFLMCPRLDPGDAVIFPETVVHGARLVDPAQQRISLYFMFTAGHVVWRHSESPFSLKHFQKYADRLGIGDILRPAGLAGCAELETGNGGNWMRTPTRGPGDA